MEFSSKEVLELQEKLKSVLSEKRYLHTIGVAYLAASLAMCHGISHRDALVAGLLHDCAKHYDETFLTEQCVALGLQVSEHELKLPWLLHAAYGAYLAEQEYHIVNPDILRAIRNHTVGRPEMTPLEQIIFVADYFEPERTQKTEPPLDEIRKIAFGNLEEAVYLVLENTIRYLTSSGQEMAPETQETYQYYCNRRVK